MKYLLILVLSLTATFARAEENRVAGTFETVPFNVLMNLPDSVSEKMKDLSEKSKQTLVITEKDMSLNTGFGGGIHMTYTAQGDFLLGKTVIGKAEMFYPIYVKDQDTLFLARQKFVRKKEASE